MLKMNSSSGLLVELDYEDSREKDELKEESTLVSSLDGLEQTSHLSTEDNNSSYKLSGFLTKITSNGLIKTSKSRWFSFNSDTCELFYYRSNIETVNNPPLGKIPLQQASFSFTTTGLKDNIFTISADSVTHLLQTPNKQTLLWWLQELQSQRRIFNLTKTKDVVEPNDCHGTVLGQSLFWVQNISNATPGLLNVTNNQLTAKKGTLESQATKLCSGNRLSVSESKPSSASSSNADINYPAVICTLKQKQVQLQEEMELLKVKLQSKEEAVQLLKLELEEFEELKDLKLQQRTFSKNDYKLRSELITLQLHKERLEQDISESSTQNQAFQERISMLEEMLVIKDEVVMQLSNKIHDLEARVKFLEEENEKLKVETNEEFVILTPTEATESFTELKDRLEGYVMQNQFLNNEVMELANLRQIDLQKIQTFQGKILQNEAEFCQLRSKYLVLLSEMNTPRSESLGLAVGDTKINACDKDRKEMLKILIQDAMKSSEPDSIDASLLKESHSRYDRFGFSTLPDDDTESTLLNTASQLQKRSADIFQSLDSFKVSVAVKWQNYFTINKELQHNDEVKSLIRLGVPHELRPKVWSWMIDVLTIPLRQKMELGSAYYHDLVNSKEPPLPSKQIELDLLRTLPNNRHFSSMSSTGIKQLRRVLRAYSLHNPSVGYCQGLNRVAAVALLYLGEENAFWCLVAIVECIMPADYYSTTLTASQADQRVFRDLMAEKLPRLYRHLDIARVDSSLITFNWLLCIYCDNVPPETMFHIWDCLLYEGSKVLFRYGLAFFKSVEEEILQLTDYMAIFNFLRVMSYRMHDIRKLDLLAFNGMNPFPMRKITKLRQIHIERVSAELKELDNLRRGLSSDCRAGRRKLDSDDD